MLLCAEPSSVGEQRAAVASAEPRWPQLCAVASDAHINFVALSPTKEPYVLWNWSCSGEQRFALLGMLC